MTEPAAKPRRARPERLKVRLMGAAYLTGWQVARFLPERTAFWLAEKSSLRSWRRNATRRAIVTENLRPVVGDGPHLEKIVRDAFVSYGRYWIEAFRLNDLTVEQIRRRVHFRGAEYIDAGLADRGVVLAVPHLGNWDAVGWYAADRWGLAVVVEMVRPKRLFDKFVAYRRALGMTIIPLKRGGDATGKCVDAIKRGEAVALVCDRDLSGSGIPVTMFGRTTKLPPGPAVLAIRTGARLLPSTTLQEPNGNWSAHITASITTGDEQDTPEMVAEVTQRLATAFEDLLREAPAQWHAWNPYWTDR